MAPLPGEPLAPHDQALTVSPAAGRLPAAAAAAAVWRASRGQRPGTRPGWGPPPCARGRRSAPALPDSLGESKPRRGLPPPAGAHSLYGSPGRPQPAAASLAHRAPPPSRCTVGAPPFPAVNVLAPPSGEGSGRRGANSHAPWPIGGAPQQLGHAPSHVAETALAKKCVNWVSPPSSGGSAARWGQATTLSEVERCWGIEPGGGGGQRTARERPRGFSTQTSLPLKFR